MTTTPEEEPVHEVPKIQKSRNKWWVLLLTVIVLLAVFVFLFYTAKMLMKGGKNNNTKKWTIKGGDGCGCNAGLSHP